MQQNAFNGTTKLKLMKPMWHQTIECKLNYLKGYLGDFNFGDQIRALRLHDVNLVENGQLVAALFRDYSMLAAAYLLEPVCVAVTVNTMIRRFLQTDT